MHITEVLRRCHWLSDSWSKISFAYCAYRGLTITIDAISKAVMGANNNNNLQSFVQSTTSSHPAVVHCQHPQQAATNVNINMMKIKTKQEK